MKNKFRRIMYVLVCFICWLYIIVSVIYLLNDFGWRVEEYNIIKETRSEKKKDIEDTSSYTTDVNMESSTTEEKQILKEYISLYEKNNDLYGWIKIEDTNIDFPVMFTPEEPNFYENKNLEKEVCKVGMCIWIDGRTTENTDNVIIYGHNVKYGMMFGSLKKYKKQDFYQDHKYIQFDTLYKKATYEIIGVVETKDYSEDESYNHYEFYDHMEFRTQEEFQEYINYAKENSVYHIETTAEYGEHIITLCTCDNTTENGRLLIIAKKIN